MSNARNVCLISFLVIALAAITTCAIAQHYGSVYQSPYVVGDCPSGYCIPNPANYGYYQTGWRRWPTSIPASPHRDQPTTSPIESLPPAELPDPRFEAEITPPQPGARTPQRERSPEFPSLDPLPPPPAENTAPTLPPFELPAPPDSSHLPRPKSIVESHSAAASPIRQRLVAVPVPPDRVEFSPKNSLHQNASTAQAIVSVKATTPKPVERVRHIIAAPRQQSDVQSPAATLSIGLPTVAPPTAVSMENTQLPRAVAPVSWQNPFRNEFVNDTVNVDAAPSPASTPDLTPSIDHVADDSPPRPIPSEPRRIELPDLISPLPPVARNISSDKITRDASSAAVRQERKSTNAMLASPASHRSLSDQNPLRAHASYGLAPSSSTNPLRAPDANNPVRGGQDANADQPFRNPLRD